MYFIDSGVWIGAFNPKDVHHPEAKPILKSVASGELGKVLLTDHVFGEIVTYLRRKMGVEQSIKAAEAILNSKCAEIIFVDEDILMLLIISLRDISNSASRMPQA